MLQLSKKVEYGLIALRHMAMKPIGNVVTTKELANEYDLPYELLAKIMQKLVRGGVVRSLQGVKGGYTLAQRPSELKVASVIRIIDDSKPMVPHGAQNLQPGGLRPGNCGGHPNSNLRISVPS